MINKAGAIKLRRLLRYNTIMKLIQDKILFPDVLWERPLNIHKRILGKVLVIAGSRGMAGAAALTLESAYRAGAGIVTLGFPEGLSQVYKKILPEAMTIPLPETPAGTISLKAKDIIIKNSKDFDCVVIGPGLSQNAETQQLVWEIFFQIEKPIILDADGLNAISLGFKVIKGVKQSGDIIEILKKRKEATIITPHAGEMLRIIKAIRGRGEYQKITSDFIDKKKQEFATLVSEKLGFIVVLKGNETAISEPGRIVINKTGNPGMATAGSGDVLAGIIGTFVSQNLKRLYEAVSTAVYLHGVAGDIAKEKIGERSMIASDIIKYLSNAIKSAEKEIENE